MKELIQEIKSYIAELFIFWAMYIDPEVIIEIPQLTEVEMLIKHIKKTSRLHKWDMISENKRSNLISFKKEGVRLDVYYKKNSTFTNMNLTISSSMKHPKGKTQLHRKNVDRKIFIEILKDPRTHTGKGYYKKSN